MNARVVLTTVLLCMSNGAALGQQKDSAAPRRLTLHEAVQLALQHNHLVHIAKSSVDEKQYAKDVARSAYFPVIRNDSTFVHVTDTQFIAIPAGGLGAVGSNLIPPHPLVISQGGLTFETSGTGLVQPLTQLFKIRAANDIARGDLNAVRGKERGIENNIAFTVHQLYYKILIVDLQHSAVQAKIQASMDLQSERVQQVKYGSALDSDVIESRAQSLQSKQELLSTELQLSDLRMQFNDVIGLPLTMAVMLDPNLADTPESCTREECMKLALESHPEVAEAHANVQKAESGVRLAKYEYMPDLDAFARYSYQNNVPFLARNFGSFGIHFSYELFDGGKRRYTLREREAQLAQTKENLARIKDEVELRVQTAYNKLERTRQMVAVSEELVSLRKESGRVAAAQLANGNLLRSQAQAAVAQELEANVLLLQSQLDYVQAHDELKQAIGETPE
jgi:outer membrane protein TolC